MPHSILFTSGYHSCCSYIQTFGIFFILLHQIQSCHSVHTNRNDYACNICRDSPDGERLLINPDKTFTQSNGVTVSCGELQEWVQDVSPSGGAPGEARYCQLVQYVAWLNCDCIGPEIPSPEEKVKDPNAACNLCENPDLDFTFVPTVNEEKLTDTGCCGQHTCGSLYHAASQGVFTANLCSQVQEKSGRDCCDLDVLEPPTDIDSDNETPCKDNPSFRFKGKKRRDCNWIKEKEQKKRKRICRRKSSGEKVWRSCPETCGKC